MNAEEEKQEKPCCAECAKNERCVLETRCKGSCDDTVSCPYMNGCTDFVKGEWE
jgi:hypothetical protein